MLESSALANQGQDWHTDSLQSLLEHQAWSHAEIERVLALQTDFTSFYSGLLVNSRSLSAALVSPSPSSFSPQAVQRVSQPGCEQVAVPRVPLRTPAAGLMAPPRSRPHTPTTAAGLMGPPRSRPPTPTPTAGLMRPPAVSPGATSGLATAYASALVAYTANPDTPGPSVPPSPPDSQTGFLDRVDRARRNTQIACVRVMGERHQEQMSTSPNTNGLALPMRTPRLTPANQLQQRCMQAACMMATPRGARRAPELGMAVTTPRGPRGAPELAQGQGVISTPRGTRRTSGVTEPRWNTGGTTARGSHSISGHIAAKAVQTGGKAREGGGRAATNTSPLTPAGLQSMSGASTPRGERRAMATPSPVGSHGSSQFQAQLQRTRIRPPSGPGTTSPAPPWGAGGTVATPSRRTLPPALLLQVSVKTEPKTDPPRAAAREKGLKTPTTTGKKPCTHQDSTANPRSCAPAPAHTRGLSFSSMLSSAGGDILDSLGTCHFDQGLPTPHAARGAGQWKQSSAARQGPSPHPCASAADRIEATHTATRAEEEHGQHAPLAPDCCPAARPHPMLVVPPLNLGLSTSRAAGGGDSDGDSRDVAPPPTRPNIPKLALGFLVAKDTADDAKGLRDTGRPARAGVPKLALGRLSRDAREDSRALDQG